MTRTTVYLPEDLKQELERQAKRRGRSEADIIREALTKELRGGGRTIKDMRFGLFRDGGNVSERVDELLAETGFGRS